MTKYYQIGGEYVPYLPSHNGGTTMAGDGTAHALTVPDGSRMAVIRPEGGAAYYNVGTAAAGTTSAGYAPQDTVDMIFQCDNLAALNIFAASGVNVHVQFYT